MSLRTLSVIAATLIPQVNGESQGSPIQFNPEQIVIDPYADRFKRWKAGDEKERVELRNEIYFEKMELRKKNCYC